jgi:FkbM family methyltransferase
MTKIILSLFDFFWSFLPKRVKVHLIQSRSNVGTLDTPKKDIKMKLESKETLYRLNSCSKEPETIKWLDGYVKPNEVLFDIGANVGAYSLYAASVVGSKVYSFEPSPSTFKLLLENIYINRLSRNIIPFNIPLSSSTDLKEFKYSTLDSGAASHAGLEQAAGSEETISQPVLTITLDDLVLKYKVPQPSHMKIDVDGHELDILKGASNVLRNPVLRSVQVELSERDQNYDSIIEVMKTAQLRIDQINTHPNSKITDIVFVK